MRVGENLTLLVQNMFSIKKITQEFKKSPTFISIGFFAEYIGKLTVLIGIVSYVWEGHDRAKQRYYQAWQVINSAHLLPGDSGRMNAIKDLIDNQNSLYAIDLTNANIDQFDMSKAKMENAIFSQCTINSTNFNKSTLQSAFFGGVIFDSNSFTDANLVQAKFAGVTFKKNNLFIHTHLENAEFRSVTFDPVVDINFTNAFLDGAKLDGHVITESDLQPGRVILCNTKLSTGISNRDCKVTTP